MNNASNVRTMQRRPMPRKFQWSDLVAVTEALDMSPRGHSADTEPAADRDHAIVVLLGGCATHES